MQEYPQKLIVRELAPEEYALWDNLVNDTSVGTVFHTTQWGKVISNLTQRQFKIMATFDKNKIDGGMLFWPQKKFSIKAITFMPATPYQGILTHQLKTDRKSSLIASQQRTVKTLLEKLKNEYDFIQFSLAPGINDVRPYLWEGFNAFPVYTYSFTIIPMAKLEFQFNRTLRQNIRTAKNEGLYTESSDHIEPLIEFVKSSYLMHHKIPPISGDQLKILFQEILNQKLGSIYYLKTKSKILAGLIVLHDSKSVYALFMGIDPTERNQNYNKYIYASVMEMKEHLGKKFDFLGANEQDFEILKRSFGGELENFYKVSYTRNTWIKWLAVLREKQHFYHRKSS